MCKPASFINLKGCGEVCMSLDTFAAMDKFDEIDRLKRENDEIIAATCTTLSNMLDEIDRLKAALTLKRSAPDDYEIMLKSLQANLISVRDQRDDANAQLRRANKTLARLRLELDAARAERDKRLTVEQVKRWLMRGMDVTAYSAGMIVDDPEYGILAGAKEPIQPEPPDPYAGDDVEMHIDIRWDDATEKKDTNTG